MITPRKIHSILRKAGIERSLYTSKCFYRIAGEPPIQMDIDGTAETRIKVRQALEGAGIVIQPQMRRWLTVNLEQEEG